jgi:hypothetical protein
LKEILLLEIVLKFYKPIIFRVFCNEFLVESIHIEAYLIEQKIYDGNIVENIFLGLGCSFETGFHEPAFFY